MLQNFSITICNPLQSSNFIIILNFNIIIKTYVTSKARKLYRGAGSGNRTRIASLEGWNSTIELHLHISS